MEFPTIPVFFTTLCCCLGCLGFGLQVGYTSPVLPQLTKPGELLHRDEDAASQFGSMGALGLAFGCFAAGWLTEHLGRRWTAILNCVPFFIGWMMIHQAQSLSYLLLGRVLTGSASAIAGVLSPMYVAEISPKTLRGVLVTGTNFCITLGVFSGYLMGLFISWREQAAVGAVLAALSLFLVPIAPETPRFLVKIGEVAQAKQVLKLLHGEDSDFQHELRNIEETLVKKTIGFAQVVKHPRTQGPLFVALGLMVFCSLTGIVVIMFFMSTILKDAGYNDRESLQAPAVIVFLQLLSIMVSGAVLDKVGRKPILLYTSYGMAASYLLMGIFFYFKFEAAWLYFLCLVAYKLAFGFGWGVICSLMATEVTPTQARGTATALSHMCAAIVSFMLASTFHVMQATLGSHGVVWLYSAFCLLGGAFVVKWVPETKGKTLEEIEGFFTENCYFREQIMHSNVY